MQKNRLILRLELWNSYNMVGMQLGILIQKWHWDFFFCLFLKCFDSGITLRLMYQRDSCTTWKLILLQYGLFDKSQILILHFRELMHRIMTVQIFSAFPLYKIRKVKCQRNFHYHLKTRNQSMGNSNGVLIMTKDQVITTYCEKFSKKLFNHQPVPFL